jgi:hypothetical protein
MACRATRELVTALIDEKLYEEGDREALARLLARDRNVGGYRFGPPSPRIFHPYASFPIELPRRDDLFVTVYDGLGKLVFADTARDVEPGPYTHAFRRFGWHRRDANGHEVPSGFHIYRGEAPHAAAHGERLAMAGAIFGMGISRRCHSRQTV